MTLKSDASCTASQPQAASARNHLLGGSHLGVPDFRVEADFGINVLRLTCVERQRVDEGAGDLLRRSLVPQREVISVEHALLVLRRQEVS